MVDRTREPKEVAVRFQPKHGKALPRQATSGGIMVMQSVPVNPGLSVPAEALSIAFTRKLEGEDGAEAARVTPSVVELRVDTRLWSALTAEQTERLVGFPRLKADRRGTIRAVCSEHPSRAMNLAGAREQLAWLIQQALTVQADEGPAPQPKRKRRTGLNKGTAVAAAPRARTEPRSWNDAPRSWNDTSE